MMMQPWITPFIARPTSRGASAEPPVRLWHGLTACRRRAVERRELRCLDEHSRRDLGPKRVAEEVGKAFWIE